LTAFAPTVTKQRDILMEPTTALKVMWMPIRARLWTALMFASFWPDATSEDAKVTDGMNSIPKIVFSRSLKEVRRGNHGNISLVSEDAVAYIKRLKAGDGKNMIMWGSLSFAQPLLEAGLFDEIRLVVVPVAIGKGYKLFPETAGLFLLKLTGSKTFSRGTVLHIYKPEA